MTANADALAHWNGATGRHWAAEAERYDRMNRHFADRLLDAAAPAPGERILDVGCGNGALTLALAQRVSPGGEAIGIDLSDPMLEVARARAADLGLANVQFLHADAQTHPLPNAELDAVVSRFGVMFFDDPHAAFTNLTRSLRPGGRLAFTCWQDMANNDWVMVPATAALQHVPIPADMQGTAAHRAFSLADPTATTALLEAAGLTHITIEPVTAPMWLGPSVEDAVAFMRTTEFADTLFTGATPDQATAAWHAIADALTGHAGPDGVELDGATWLVTATAP